MKYNLPEKLNKIKIKNLSDEDKNLIWSGIIYKKSKKVGKSLLPFNLKINMIGVLIALAVVLGGGGVVAASNAAVPGDTLYGVDLAAEKAKIALVSGEDKKNNFKIKFAEERLSEVETIVERRGASFSQNADLSNSTVTELEINVFTNETTVKIEAGDKKYGFTTVEKEKSKIIEEIKTKYKLTDSQINAVISFETEDRDVRADDRKFLNGGSSLSFKSEKQQKEFEGSLNEVADLVSNSNLSVEQKASISKTLAGIMTLLSTDPNLKMEVKTQDGLKFEIENGKVEIKTNTGKGDSSDDSDDSKKDDDDEDEDDKHDNKGGLNVNLGGGINFGGDDDSDNDSDDSEDDSDNDSNDDDSHDDEDEDEDDNSGHGGGDDSDDGSEDDN